MDASPFPPVGALIYLAPVAGEGEIVLRTYGVPGISWLWGYIREEERSGPCFFGLRSWRERGH